MKLVMFPQQTKTAKAWKQLLLAIRAFSIDLDHSMLCRKELGGRAQYITAPHVHSLPLRRTITGIILILFLLVGF
jgi:hypothetical protein